MSDHAEIPGASDYDIDLGDPDVFSAWTRFYEDLANAAARLKPGQGVQLPVEQYTQQEDGSLRVTADADGIGLHLAMTVPAGKWSRYGRVNVFARHLKEFR
jgi:hypothetical protein